MHARCIASLPRPALTSTHLPTCIHCFVTLQYRGKLGLCPTKGLALQCCCPLCFTASTNHVVPISSNNSLLSVLTCAGTGRHRQAQAGAGEGTGTCTGMGLQSICSCCCSCFKRIAYRDAIAAKGSCWGDGCISCLSTVQAMGRKHSLFFFLKACVLARLGNQDRDLESQRCAVTPHPGICTRLPVLCTSPSRAGCRTPNPD